MNYCVVVCCFGREEKGKRRGGREARVYITMASMTE